jgi:molecular chaperone DnaJ
MSSKRKETHYQILGVESNVGSPEIKRAYRELVKSLHPDVGHAEQTHEDRTAATERMMLLNEAYETLMDRSKRSAYDTELGISRSNRVFVQVKSMVSEDEARERFLRQVFHPSRHAILRVLNLYQRQMRQLSQDIYDEQLVARFERYVDTYEATLRKSSQDLSSEQSPETLKAAVQMLRYCIAQAADGLEEMRRFCSNFDYDHLIMAQNLIRIAQDLSRQALNLTKY